MTHRVTFREFEKEYPAGTLVRQVAKDLADYSDTPIVALKVNNKLSEFHKALKAPHNDVALVNLADVDGYRMYQRSISFIFIRAVRALYPGARVDIQHSLSRGLFCMVNKAEALTENDVSAIERQMQTLIAADEPFEKLSLKITEAEAIFQKQDMIAKVDLIKYRRSDYINVYKYGELYNYFYGYMCDRAGQLRNGFELTYFNGGVILRTPTPYSNGAVPAFEAQPKISQIHRETERWGDILNVGYIANINDAILNETIKELILINEGLHEKKIAQIADQITRQNRHIILIAGPSSSGKTTFANRLKIQLRANGLRPVTLGTDDYFVNRELTPRDKDGEYNFETIDAVDLVQFNNDLLGLLAGDLVELPSFNFHLGQREYHGKKLKIDQDQPIIIEGIHGLNPRLTEKIAAEQKFKIYISCLTQLNIDNHNRIPTTDSRLIRRMVRDHKHRGHSVSRTIAMWKSVRRGEERNIFPFQESADAVFNSALIYELAVLKKHVEPLLLSVPNNAPEYGEVKRLLKFLSYVISVPSDSIIPNTSILKEFIGGSIFEE